MKDYVVVDQSVLDSDTLPFWIELATRFVGSLPPKAHKASRKSRA